MDNPSPPVEFSPRPKPEKAPDSQTEKKTAERRHKLGGILLGAGPENSNEDKKQTDKKDKKPKDKKKAHLTLVPSIVAEPPALHHDNEDRSSSAEADHSPALEFVDSLKALRREQAIIANVEAAQPEVIRARSLARQILLKVRRERATVPPESDWRTASVPLRTAELGHIEELDAAIQEGERIDRHVRSAVQEHQVRFEAPELPAASGHALGFHYRLRSLMFPALAAGTGVALASAPGLGARGVEMPASMAALTGELVVPRRESVTQKAATSISLFGAATLFIAGLMVGSRRGEQRAERRFAAEHADLQRQIDQAILEAPAESLPESSPEIELRLQQEIKTQQTITAEQEQRFEQINTLAMTPATEARPHVPTDSVAEFRLPVQGAVELKTGTTAERYLAAEAVISSKAELRPTPTIPDTPERPSSAEAKTISPSSMSEYALKPIIIQRLERITGNRRSAEHVYELLKASHSSPAEILALTPEKLKAKADDAVKRDAARLVLGKTLQTSTEEAGTVESEPYDHHSLLHELEKPAAVMSPKDFLLRPSKQRDWALIAAGITVVGIIGLIVIF